MVQVKDSGSARVASMSTLQKMAGAFGVVFLLVGLAGFIPGVTSRFSDLGVAGHESSAELLGLFQVSVLHNVVHLLFGVVGLLAAKRADLSRQFLIFGGATYLVLTAYGFIVDLGTSANFVPVNTADNFLHLFLGVSMVGLGLALSPARATARA